MLVEVGDVLEACRTSGGQAAGFPRAERGFGGTRDRPYRTMDGAVAGAADGGVSLLPGRVACYAQRREWEESLPRESAEVSIVARAWRPECTFVVPKSDPLLTFTLSNLRSGR